VFGGGFRDFVFYMDGLPFLKRELVGFGVNVEDPTC
jgi:hypothetical protein